MKKIKFILPVIFLLILTGCSNQGKSQESQPPKLSIVAAIFPAYDWTRNIIGDNPADMELTLLLDNGVDLHSYQPSVDDLLKISQADCFIYVGGESDQWVSDALKQASNPNMKVIKMLDVIGDAARTEETVEGMQMEDDEDNDEAEYDEHVWLSLRNASIIVDAICGAVSELNPENASLYKDNAVSYKAQLTVLDDAYSRVIDSAAFHTLLFGDRFPFRYLVEDYGLDYYAAFSGCSAETEASFETITFLADRVNALNLPVVLTIDGTDHRIAETIVRNTSEKTNQILTLDSMQSVSAKDIEAGTTYLSIMENNLDVLRQALEAN